MFGPAGLLLATLLPLAAAKSRHVACKSPLAYEGTVRYEGCVRFQCTKKGKRATWRQSPAYDKCCVNNQTLIPAENSVATLVSGDNCTKTELTCALLGGRPNIKAETTDTCRTELMQKIDQIQNAVNTIETQAINEKIAENKKIILEMKEDCANGTSLLLNLIEDQCAAQATITTAIATSTSTSTTTKTTTTKTTTTTTTTTKTTTTAAGGLVITGGYGAYKSVEVWSPDSGHICSGPELPDTGYGHSADLTPAGIVICGGSGGMTSGIVWAPGTSTWSSHATIQKRRHHVSWLTSAGQLVIIGGYNGGIVLSSTEIVGVGPGFTLQRPTEKACLINQEETILLTGGSSFGSIANVDQYDVNNFIKSFPSLQQARYYHACGEVSGTLIVAGGSGGGLDTTELLRPGASAWQFAAALPHKMYGHRGAKIGGSFYLTGGTGGHRNEILRYNLTGDVWNKVGTMENARYSHAVTVLDDVAAFCGN